MPERPIRQLIKLCSLIRSTLILASICMAGSANAQKPVTAQDVQRAIDRTVSFLLKSQEKDGGWKEFMEYDRGVSSLVTLALLNAGQDPESPNMKRALTYIAAKQLNRTYTVSLQTMALCAANPNRYAKQINANLQWLVEHQLGDGGWGYGNRQDSSDESNSQYALLALHEAQRVGIEPPEKIRQQCFDAARGYWHRRQNRDGSFGYRDAQPLGSMTCAGIASMIIVGSQADQLASGVSDSVRCCGQSHDNQSKIDLAIDWMGKNFSVHTNPGSGGFFYYYMYGLERAGRLSGQRYFVDQRGNRDWYREGSHVLLSQQDATGSFRNAELGNAYSESAFALLFLAKGKRQVVVNRLQYGDSGDWNNHSWAIQHLTAHTEKAWKRDLAWQTVRLQQATVEDLLEAPVLFISGSRAPNFTREEKLLLKRYVEQNGFIFAEACNGDGCQGAEFEEYFKKLVVELFEQPLDKLPPEHPIWSAEARVDPQDLPEGSWLYGVQSCCSLRVVYCPYSLSCRWQLNLPYGNHPEYAKPVQGDVNTATKIGINVLTYATGKELKEKLDTVSVLQEVVQKTSTDRGLFVLPILTHNAGFDDAPRSTKTLVEWLNQENPFQISSQKRMIPIAQDQLQPYTLVYMHGRGNLELTEVQREALRVHFQNGGTLIADAICGDDQFANSFRAEMELILGKPLTTLDASRHPLFASKPYKGFDIRELTVIDPITGVANAAGSIQKRAPVIEAGQLDNRIVALFSPLDISCALESKHSLQCKGYTREDAARLGINMILFALQQ